ncbi:MAG TPA: complex I NDUFA9 subunit family protein [Gaiellaceae bacterium]|nr:complex I NDUFA9 subunit family protein [Gaiellaceae bacterium]
MILVTGGTGFVGPKIVHALRAEGRDVRCLVRRPEQASTLRAWGCELVRGDVADGESLRRAAEGCDVVVHLVAIIAGRPSDFERVMVEGTRSLVAAAAEAGTGRFVLMSALGVSEQTRRLVPYYQAKWEMERAVLASGIEHVVFRPSFVFGRDGGVLPLFVRQVRWSPIVPVVGDGRRRLQPIWVDDLAAFFAKAIDLPEAANRTFELGGPEQLTWNELYERIARVLGKRRAQLHLPVPLVRTGAAVAERLPRPPITRDQLTMLEAGDNVCDNGPALTTFGVELTPLDEQLRRAA